MAVTLGLGIAQDCNSNDAPDDYDIADGVSRDANNNGIPDECECPTDLDADGAVAILDLLTLSANWGQCN